jgi:hypothetical protein
MVATMKMQMVATMKMQMVEMTQALQSTQLTLAERRPIQTEEDT